MSGFVRGKGQMLGKMPYILESGDEVHFLNIRASGLSLCPLFHTLHRLPSTKRFLLMTNLFPP